MIKDFRKAIRKKRLLRGVLVTIPSPEVVELLSLAGFDWLFFDLEHSGINFQALQNLIRASSSRCYCAVRIPENNPVYVAKALDAGAEALIFPKINSEEAARVAVSSSKYPPMGSRGLGVSRAHGYGLNFGEYLRVANERTALLMQIEDRIGLQNVEAIAQVEGIDGLFVGPYDLSASLGITGQVDHPYIIEAIERISRCRCAGLSLGIFSLDLGLLVEYSQLGFTILACSTDMALLSHGVKSILSGLDNKEGKL